VDSDATFVVSRSAPAPQSVDPYRAALARFYDLGVDGFEDDLGLYLGLAHRRRGRILELGCGSGRVMAAIARSGYHVVGLDRAAGMLVRARQRLEGEGQPALLVQADMTAPPLAEPFEMIFVALDGFLHLTARSEQLAALGQARRLLTNRGVLVLDLPGPAAPGWDDWSPGARPLVPVWSSTAEDGSRLAKFSAFSVDASAQCHHVSEIYESTQIDGSVRRWFAEYELRFVFPFELELLLERSGLQLVARYGDYDLGPFDGASPRQICVACRARRRRRA